MMVNMMVEASTWCLVSPVQDDRQAYGSSGGDDGWVSENKQPTLQQSKGLSRWTMISPVAVAAADKYVRERWGSDFPDGLATRKRDKGSKGTERNMRRVCLLSDAEVDELERNLDTEYPQLAGTS